MGNVAARGRWDAAGAVVITGVGSVSALGIGGGASLAAALVRGVPAIRPVQAFSTGHGPHRLGGEVGDLTPHLTADEVRRLSRASQLAVVACRLALADAGIDVGTLPGLGLVLGSAYGDFRSSEAFALGYLTRGPLGLSPMAFPNTVMNAMAAHAAIAVAAQGPMLTVNQAGIAGELAVVRAAGFIAAGRAPAVLAGGVDDLCPILYRELGRLGAISPRGSGPEGCWPFDRRANGTVVGEGATVLLLEAADAARARGARVYATLAGIASGNLPAAPHALPPRRRRDPAVVRRALAAAGIGPDAVDAAYLTGTGDPAQDACELDLMAGVFDGAVGRRPLLTSLTPLAGEHAGMGGLRVAAAAVATVAGGELPGLPDLAVPAREGFAFARGPVVPLPGARAVLLHALARGGGHAALVLGRAA
ncbi:MAG TPA: beta-ketoacyl synthase N-terminal-like domain-containing protein [Methylomirabilota bacterium]|jgi:3-oxoacyl-[acyl-carrier-protein] synthase II|nr:beta-ketoacyl synthase N-terminal-like domain-containing protein [Methylomirabilota bacterium]